MSNNDAEAVSFKVYVDDNGHFMDEDSRWEAGPYSSYEEALAKCHRIVKINVEEFMEPGATAEEAYSKYLMFGDDPWIDVTPEGLTRFSARDFAKQLFLSLEAAAPA